MTLLPLLLAATLVSAALGDAPKQADLVLRGAAVYTLDPAQPWARAVAIRDGRIDYVGDEDGLAARIGTHTRIIALRGGMVLPGFHDSHVHPMSGGLRLLRCRLADAGTPRALERRASECARDSDDPWLLGSGLAVAAFGAAGPTRARLDALVPDRPAFLTTEDGFSGWVNTRALELAGLDDEDADGLNRATGLVERDAAQRIRRAIPAPTQAQYRAALRAATALANASGITSVVDAAASPAMVEAYRAADAAGELTVRVRAAQRVDPAQDAAQVDAMIERRERTRGVRFRADGAKLFLDGEIDQHSAVLLADYADAPGARGTPYFAAARLDAIVARLDAAGFALHFHAMGDGAVRAALDAIERAIAANGARDRRHQIAHVALVDAADLARFGALGVAADIQGLWAQDDAATAAAGAAALGPDRARRQLAFATLARSGARIVGGSDWPSPSMAPLDAIQVALTRQPLDGSRPAREPEQRLDLATLVVAYTREAAWVAGEDALDGTIAVGKAADLAVLDRDLFHIAPRDVHRARVLLTLLDGAPVHRDRSLCVLASCARFAEAHAR